AASTYGFRPPDKGAASFRRAGGSSALDAPVLVEDRELDELRAGPVVLREIDEKVAEVHVFHAMNRLGERRRAGARLPQPVDQHLRRDIALHRPLGDVGVLGRGREQLLVLADDAEAARGGERPENPEAVARDEL